VSLAAAWPGDGEGNTNLLNLGATNLYVKLYLLNSINSVFRIQNALGCSLLVIGVHGHGYFKSVFGGIWWALRGYYSSIYFDVYVYVYNTIKCTVYMCYVLAVYVAVACIGYMVHSVFVRVFLFYFCGEEEGGKVEVGIRVRVAFLQTSTSGVQYSRKQNPLETFENVFIVVTLYFL